MHGHFDVLCCCLNPAMHKVKGPPPNRLWDNDKLVCVSSTAGQSCVPRCGTAYDGQESSGSHELLAGVSCKDCNLSGQYHMSPLKNFPSCVASSSGPAASSSLSWSPSAAGSTSKSENSDAKVTSLATSGSLSSSHQCPIDARYCSVSGI